MTEVSFACFTDHRCLGYAWMEGKKVWCECECHTLPPLQKPLTVWGWLRKRFGEVL